MPISPSYSCTLHSFWVWHDGLLLTVLFLSTVGSSVPIQLRMYCGLKFRGNAFQDMAGQGTIGGGRYRENSQLNPTFVTVTTTTSDSNECFAVVTGFPAARSRFRRAAPNNDKNRGVRKKAGSGLKVSSVPPCSKCLTWQLFCIFTSARGVSVVHCSVLTKEHERQAEQQPTFVGTSAFGWS